MKKHRLKTIVRPNFSMKLKPLSLNTIKKSGYDGMRVIINIVLKINAKNVNSPRKESGLIPRITLILIIFRNTMNTVIRDIIKIIMLILAFDLNKNLLNVFPILIKIFN